MANKQLKSQESIPRDLQKELKAKITHFLDYGDSNILVLTGLPNDQRKFLHKYAFSIGLKSKSYGGKNQRELHITLPKNLRMLGDTRILELSDVTRGYFFTSFLDQLKESTYPTSSGYDKLFQRKRNRIRNECLLLGLCSRLVPPRPTRLNKKLRKDKMELPIFLYQNAINDVLRSNSVVIINGETGSGKTTQVPQYILEEYARLNKPCRVICTQPRRIATVTVATRVAEERGEPVGESVGYQIRLESRVRKTTNLVYTTSGCVLRSIMADARDFFQKTTHLIIDEIHERDKDTDFILIAVKEQLKYNKNLKVILMSATMDIHLLSTYFNGCPVVNVPGQGFDVKIYQLEDILFHTGYRTSLMEKYLRLSPAEISKKVVQADEHTQSIFDAIIDEILEVHLRLESIIEYFDQLQYYIENEGVSIDLRHSKTGKTALITAAQCNIPQYVTRFMQLNADGSIRDYSGKSALTYAAAFEDGICLQLLGYAQQNNETMSEKQILLSAYTQQFHDENEVDHYLIISLLEGLYRSKHPGAILVFLPGYNDIVAQKDLITSTLPGGTYKMFILHGQMESNDQWLAMQPQRHRKIILSTNIGQTSITIPDLAFIIDSGKVKMKTHDVITGSSELRSVWISQADANQRSGRAGRTQNGVCYRLYSTEVYQHMSKHSIPELMRIPLTEICLYAKSFDPLSNVESFLSRALNPPSSIIVQNAIKKLKIVGVFTDDERITELGRHLVEIPVDVQLGKALVFSVFFKCIDPIVTIVAFHSVKDPFILPTDRSLQGQASFQRKSLSGDYYSDHMGILVLYDSYMAIRNNKRRKQEFCSKLFLSAPCMEVFCATRRQIYDLIVNKYSITADQKINNSDWNIIRLCIVAGLYPNIALIDRKQMSIKSGTEKELILQRSSSLNPPGKKSLKEFASKLPYDWLVFYEKSKLYRMYSINMNTLLAPVLVAMQCGRDYMVETEGCSITDQEFNPVDEYIPDANEDEPIARRSVLTLDSWIKFDMSENDVDILITLRNLVQSEFIKFLYQGHSETSAKTVEYVQYMLNAELNECSLHP